MLFFTYLDFFIIIFSYLKDFKIIYFYFEYEKNNFHIQSKNKVIIHK